jgi:pimeloyl-ACP methyl ester carboxylesterase
MIRRLITALRPLLVIVTVSLLAPGGSTALAAPGPSLALLRAAGAAEVQEVVVRPPSDDTSGEPLQVLIALHAMGGNGADFASALSSQGEAHGWLIVAPTITYGDWTNPALIRHEEPALIAWLSDYVQHLAIRTGYAVQPQVLVFGHSRGAQLALRFTEIHPELVAGVSAVSAGTYTLPFSRDARTGHPLQFPFGVADLANTDGGKAFDSGRFRSVPIWIGVGGADSSDDDVPDDWDAFIGKDRLSRAHAFTRALQSFGADVALTVFPDAGHALTDDMLVAGCDALAGVEIRS